jgi:hypothetical protein
VKVVFALCIKVNFGFVFRVDGAIDKPRFQLRSLLEIFVANNTIRVVTTKEKPHKRRSYHNNEEPYRSYFTVQGLIT